MFVSVLRELRQLGNNAEFGGNFIVGNSHYVICRLRWRCDDVTSGK